MDGSELHRLRSFDQDYDPDLFNKLYKSMKPLMRRLASQVDCRRFNVTPDIILSYFSDKFIYVFNKYHKEYDEEHLKAALLSSLQTFKNRLLRNAYSKDAEYNLSMASLEDLFDDSKELIDDSEEEMIKEEQLKVLYAYMKEKLSPDAYLLFEILNNPPEFFRERMKTDNSHISASLILEFFEIPKTKDNATWIGYMRDDIKFWLDKAKEDLQNKTEVEGY